MYILIKAVYLKQGRAKSLIRMDDDDDDDDKGIEKVSIIIYSIWFDILFSQQ